MSFDQLIRSPLTTFALCITIFTVSCAADEGKDREKSANSTGPQDESSESLQRETQNFTTTSVPTAGRVTYHADFWDDMIRLLRSSQYEWKEPTTEVLRSYFQKFRNQGITRLVIWSSAGNFALNGDTIYCAGPQAANPEKAPKVSCDQWKNFKAMMRGIYNDPTFTSRLNGIASAAHAEYVRQSRLGADAKDPNAEMTPTTWHSLRQVLNFRLNPSFQSMVMEAAAQAQLDLVFEYRPGEHAGAKVYSVPVFDKDGTFLHSFSPLMPPEGVYLADDIMFKHYRKHLMDAGKPDGHTVSSLRLHLSSTGKGIINARRALVGTAALYRELLTKVSIRAFPYPLQNGSGLVLKRTAHAVPAQASQPFVPESYQLVPYQDIHAAASGKAIRIEPSGVEYDANAGIITLKGINVPDATPYLYISGVASDPLHLKSPTNYLTTPNADSARFSVDALTASGIPIGRVGSYWIFPNEVSHSITNSNGVTTSITGLETRVAAITARGTTISEFYANENSDYLTRHLAMAEIKLDNRGALLLNLGHHNSDDLVDYSRPAARYMARRYFTAAKSAGYKSFVFNTRSHADGYDGSAFAYAPSTVKKDPLFDILATPSEVNEITVSKGIAEEGFRERSNTCQSSNCRYKWRYLRNIGVARAHEMLLKDIDGFFPAMRIQAVLPESALSTARIKDGYGIGNGKMRPALGTTIYAGGDTANPDRKTYLQLWPNYFANAANHSFVLWEGLSMVSLAGTDIEPIPVGIRYLPDAWALNLYLDIVLSEFRAGRGSSYRGPISMFYEAQATLYSDAPSYAKVRRESIMCALLMRKDINEIMSYESADWYSKPANFYDFLENCRPR